METRRQTKKFLFGDSPFPNTFRRAVINFECHTLKNLLDLKHRFKSADFRRNDMTIVSLDIKDIYPQCHFKAVKVAV
jgi:hypothetical protein